MVKTAGKQRQERQGCGSGEELRFGPSEGIEWVKILACWDGLFSRPWSSKCFSVGSTGRKQKRKLVGWLVEEINGTAKLDGLSVKK